MAETGDREFRRKAHMDLWLHQNTLFWSRFQTLYFLQGGYFAVTLFLRDHKFFVGLSLAIVLMLLVWLYHTVDQDRRLRNYHRAILKDQFEFDPLPKSFLTIPLIPMELMETGFQFFVFISFAVIDLVVALYAVKLFD